jgi:XTP/dITP diphosphohydrolase
MMKKLLVATHNKGKLIEIKEILKPLPLELIALSDLPSLNPNHLQLSQTDVKETGKSFEKNAQIKANFFAGKTKLLTVADDSGLVVEALGGFPGVTSNRWHTGTDRDRNLALLSKLDGKKNRTAKFVTVVCLSDPISLQDYFFTGEVEGRIAQSILGDEGFGYDPIFIPNNYQKTFAQLGIEKKNQLSHRQRAFVQLKQYLEVQSNLLKK